MRRRALSAVATAGLAALVLSACTVDPTSPADPSSDETTAQSEPAPVVTVVNDTLDDSAAAGQDPAAGTTSSPTADDAAGGSADAVTVEAGDELVLAVEGGDFTEVTLVDADHDAVPADTGTFDTDEG